MCHVEYLSPLALSTAATADHALAYNTYNINNIYNFDVICNIYTIYNGEISVKVYRPLCPPGRNNLIKMWLPLTEALADS